MSTIGKNAFEKSLARLEGLAKSQLFHTASDSNPGQWAGTAASDEDSMGDSIDENGTDYSGVKKSLADKVSKSKALTPAEVAIVKGQNPLKLIGAKIAKGQSLTSAENWAIKGGRKYFVKSDAMANSPKEDGAGEENKDARNVPDQNVADKADGKVNAEKGMGGMPGAGGMPQQQPGMAMKGHDDGDDDDDDKKPWEKSLANAARLQPNLSKGIEMSPILHEFVVAMGHALEGQSAKVVKSLAPIVSRIESLEKSLANLSGDQGEFNKSIAEAIVGIGQHLAGGADVAAAQASGPAYGPKAQLRAVQSGPAQGVAPIAKSFGGPGGLESGEFAMQKAQVVDVMYDMVKSNKLNSLDVIKYEATGQLSPQVHQAVLAHAQGGGR